MFQLQDAGQLIEFPVLLIWFLAISNTEHVHLRTKLIY